MIWCNFNSLFFRVGVSYRILYIFFYYLDVSCNVSIISVGEERANLSAIVSLQICGFLSEKLSLGAWDGLCYYIVTLPEPFM